MSIEVSILIAILVLEFLTLTSISVVHFEFNRRDRSNSIKESEKAETNFTSEKDLI
tara:strand:+ start:1019 stop:1186 length:168 start_codon:yes stop_codon:yes gene_type:complete